MSIDTIPLRRLVQSRRNARRTGRRVALGELTSSIRSHGLRQNLNVRPITGGRYEVVAGGRRLLALKQLARDGVLPHDHPVPCHLLADQDDPEEISLAENAVRVAMHPDDQCAAFERLVQAGSSIEEVATRFGVSVTVVRQRLRLASVSPIIRVAYRKGDLSHDQMVAFALVDDHAVQEAAWSNLPAWNNGPEAIRRALTRSALSINHRLVRYVGLEIYEAFGGTVIRDMFGGPDQAYVADGHLIERLATDQLTRVADEVRQEGWSWVTIEPDLDWSIRYDRIYPHRDETGGTSFIPDDLARAGARLSIDADGTLRIDRGLMRTQEGKAIRRSSGRKSTDTAESTLSAKLVEELSAHRTAALRVELAGRPDLALVATVHALVLSTLYHAHDVGSCLTLKGSHVPLETHVHDSEDGLAHHDLADLQATWSARLPPDPAELWGWCMGQGQAVLLDLLAFVAALSVNAVATRIDRPDSPRLQHSRQLSAALRLDMTKWWRPSPEWFGKRVAKGVLAAALTEVGQDGFALRVRAAKKAEAARLAIPVLVEAGWLPTPLRADIVSDTPSAGPEAEG